MNQYYGAYPPQSLTPQQAAALGGWQNNQNLQQMQGVGIQNGDDATGEQIARNLCESYGITPEEAYAQAMRFFRGR